MDDHPIENSKLITDVNLIRTPNATNETSPDKAKLDQVLQLQVETNELTTTLVMPVTWMISEWSDQNRNLIPIRAYYSITTPQIKPGETSAELHERLRTAVVGNTHLVSRPTFVQSNVFSIAANLEKITGIKDLVAIATTGCVHEFFQENLSLEPYSVYIGIEATPQQAQEYFPKQNKPFASNRVILPVDQRTRDKLGESIKNIAYDSLRYSS